MFDYSLKIITEATMTMCITLDGWSVHESA